MVEYNYIDERDHEFAARKGFAWVSREARATGTAWIAVQHVSNMASIVRYKGFTTLRSLAKSPFQGNVNGLLFKLITEEKLPISYETHPVLAIFPTPSYLDNLLAIQDASRMLVVPWSLKEIEGWIDQNNAQLYDHEIAQRTPAQSTTSEML